MKNKLTFCIASAKNEKEYTKLLIKSLKENTSIENHEILIFLDSDNQNSYEDFLKIQKDLPNLKIHRNETGFPVGGQRNVSIMFYHAKNDIVCYLQSDMVVGRNFDINILKNMKEENTVLCCTRIEPPIHPPGPEKIVKSFGLDPESFEYENFQNFVEELQENPRTNTEGHFAPFAVYKKTWFEKIGGFDTQFRCSREDSDTIIRMKLLNIEMVQSWEACVYHFTCVSSRGKDWFKEQSDNTNKIRNANQLQALADYEELKRFTRKWGSFFHDHQSKPVFDIGIYLNIDKYVDFKILEYIEMFCKKIYINDQQVAQHLKERVLFNAEYYSNLRWNYSKEHWDKVKHLFNQEDLDQHIQYLNHFDMSHDVNVSIDYSALEENLNASVQELFQNINVFVDTKPTGEYNLFPVRMEIKQKNDLQHTYKTYDYSKILKDANNFVFS